MSALSPVNAEALVNITTLGDQSPAGLAVLGGGQIAAAFLDGDSGSSIARVRLFAANGAPSACT